MTAEEMMEKLFEKYKDNEEAIEVLLRAQKDLEYIRKRNEGQTPEQYVLVLSGFLEMWF